MCFLLTMWSCNTTLAPLSYAGWGARCRGAAESHPGDGCLCLPPPQSSKSQRWGSELENPQGTLHSLPPTAGSLVGAKDAFLCWQSSGCKECQRLKEVWKACKGRKGRYLGQELGTRLLGGAGVCVCVCMSEWRMRGAAALISQDIWLMSIRPTSAQRAGPEPCVAGRGNTQAGCSLFPVLSAPSPSKQAGGISPREKVGAGGAKPQFPLFPVPAIAPG